ELFGDFARAFAAALDQLHLMRRFQRLGEAHTDVAATGNDHAPHRFVELAQLIDDRAYVRTRCNEEYLVVGFDHRITLRQNRLAAPVHGGHARIHVRNVILQVAQFLPDERTAVKGLHGNEANLAAGEIEYLQGARILDQATDVVDHQLLGRDQH